VEVKSEPPYCRRQERATSVKDLQLPEKYKQYFDISSEGHREVSSAGTVLPMCVYQQIAWTAV
jgi:hypothetical protein